ncbi:exported hypothetical protein [Candidatus Sulfopaludibacter sp. SbA4]|nr:exported hypothetical protein [Candidatus Sulfopaludibacter sp. SbA4]
MGFEPVAGSIFAYAGSFGAYAALGGASSGVPVGSEADSGPNLGVAGVGSAAGDAVAGGSGPFWRFEPNSSAGASVSVGCGAGLAASAAKRLDWRRSSSWRAWFERRSLTSTLRSKRLKVIGHRE